MSKKIKIETTSRGFEIGKFEDEYGLPCSIQKSSSAMKDCIWLGVDDAKPQLMSSYATRLGLRERTNDERDNGWVPFEIPSEVFLSTRMHLTQKQVKDLIPILQKFVDTGDLT